MDKTMGQILTWKAKEKNVFTRAQGKKVREKIIYSFTMQKEFAWK